MSQSCTTPLCTSSIIRKVFLRKVLLALSLSSLLGACSSPVKLDETSNKVPVEDRAGGTTGADTRGIATVDASAGDPLNDPKGVLAQRSIYFDFDSYSIKEEFKGVIEVHAKYLAANPKRKVAIEGHTDERGGSEYNLALGQQRSETVRKAFLLLGAKDEQLESVSFGKEKPKALGHDETAWAQNRRADIVYR